ncbi:MAG: fluoride efflux transporter CrcB [Marinifilaceae bacterium]|nr:fluoride efflux transporter CrcB [Marinifilaceae bacterium]
MLIAGSGGFIGTCLRFLVGKLCTNYIQGSFPWGTFLVNLVGSFIIGVLFGLVEKSQLISTNMNILLITGFCGGFTTFSSLSHDMLTLLQNRNWTIFILYTALTFIGGLLLVWAGRGMIMRN